MYFLIIRHGCLDFFQVDWVARAADVRYEVDERESSEGGWVATAPYPSGNDDKPFHGNAHRRVRHSGGAVVNSHHGDDRVVRQRRAAHPGTGNIGDHGRQHRHHAHGMDHVGGVLVRHNRLRVSGILHRPYPHI